MRATLTYTVDVDNETAAERLCDLGAELFKDQAQAVSFQSCSIEDSPFTVVGAITGKPSETWREIVQAQNPGHAREKATKGNTKRTVVAVFAGAVEVAT